MASPVLNKDFKEFAELLNANAVEYLIVGGYALAAHGHPRYTGDIDFWVHQTPENIGRLMTTLIQFGFSSLGLTADDFLKPDAVVQMGYPPARIDLMVSISGVTFANAYARRLIVTLDEVPLNFISREDFLHNKRTVGRLKDLSDADALDPPP